MMNDSHQWQYLVSLSENVKEKLSNFAVTILLTHAFVLACQFIPNICHINKTFQFLFVMVRGGSRQQQRQREHPSDFHPQILNLNQIYKKMFLFAVPISENGYFLLFSLSFELIKDSDLMFSFSVCLLLYMLLNLYILILSELFRYAMITQPKIAQPVATLLAQQYL